MEYGNTGKPGYRGCVGALAMVAAICLVAAALLAALAPEALAAKALRAQVPDLCYQCHVELKEELKGNSVHFPFKQGMCEACHAVHASDKGALVKEDINTLCLSCHNDIKTLLDGGGWHTALSQGDCASCHTAHSSEHRKLLVASEKQLCWNCHGELKGQTAKTYKHNPFEGGECASCHNPHASKEQFQLVDSPNKVCQKCHAPRCNVKGVSITHATSKMNCTQCHSGHNSDIDGLFGPYGHRPFLDKSCELCHNPIEPDKKITTLAKGEELCFFCHSKDPENFRDGDVHLMVTETPCFLCHDYHASGKKNMTVDESRVCFSCHDEIEKKIERMRKSLDYVHQEKECFSCHKPMHSRQPHYFKADVLSLCSECHQAQHSISHPIGEGVIDPRNGQTLTCVSCHSMHLARADFMLQFDRSRQLCIQCHKV
ncbi:MAG: cytochrome c3 family protein [Thermodesulfovibrionales bacterium]